MRNNNTKSNYLTFIEEAKYDTVKASHLGGTSQDVIHIINPQGQELTINNNDKSHLVYKQGNNWMNQDISCKEDVSIEHKSVDGTDYIHVTCFLI